MQNALDKRAIVKQLASTTKAGAITVYVGDSVTDLGALLEADIGIVMGDNSTLQRVATAAGITVRPLVTGPAHIMHDIAIMEVPEPCCT